VDAEGEGSEWQDTVILDLHYNSQYQRKTHTQNFFQWHSSTWRFFEKSSQKYGQEENTPYHFTRICLITVNTSGHFYERSGQKKIPKCFLRKEIPAKKRVLGNFRILDFRISIPSLSTKVQLRYRILYDVFLWLFLLQNLFVFLDVRVDVDSPRSPSLGNPIGPQQKTGPLHWS
jgi:hypothetical protein